jgi:hypothetical protein
MRRKNAGLGFFTLIEDWVRDERIYSHLHLFRFLHFESLQLAHGMKAVLGTE